ncbi:MAG: hypothetical protein JEY94_16835 [Melioribacteraceae bacterium]|nr:hypothetical protein [Melioribacteraceae bacterium]
MRKIIALILLLNCITFSKTFNETKQIDEKIVYLTFNTEFEKAEKLINQELKEDPKSLKYYFHKINTRLMRSVFIPDSLMIKNRRSYRDSLYGIWTKEVEEYLDKYEDTFEPTLENRFYIGGLYGFLGRMYGERSEWYSAFTNGKTAKNMYEDIIEEQPEFYDAYTALGMLYYYSDRLGGVMGLVTSILGLSGDREKGLEYLHLAYDKGKILNDQASILLMEIYNRLESNEEAALPFYEKFLIKYPKNKYVYMWYSWALINANEYKKLDKLIAEKEDIIEPFVKMLHFHQIGKYERSNNYRSEVEANKQRMWRRLYNHTQYIGAVNNLMLEQTEISDSLNNEQKKNYESVKENLEESIYLFRFQNLVALMNNNELAERLIADSKEFSHKPYNALFAFNCGIYFYKLNKYLKADEYFLKAKSLESSGVKYDCIKYLISIYSKHKVEKAIVEKLIDEVDDMDNDRLTFRIRDLENMYDL